MSFDVVALEELPVDFIPAGISAKQNPFLRSTQVVRLAMRWP